MNAHPAYFVVCTACKASLLTLATLAAAGCAASPNQPPALSAGADQVVARLLATYDQPQRPDLKGPGTATTSTGATVAYDRSVVVGSTLTKDRGASFEAFLEDLKAQGGTYQVVGYSQGRVSSVLVRYQNQRMLISAGQW